MTPVAWCQLALGLMRLVNWITTQVDRHQWEASGYARAMAEQQAAIARNVGDAGQIYRETANRTDEQLNRDLQE